MFSLTLKNTLTKEQGFEMELSSPTPVMPNEKELAFQQFKLLCLSGNYEEASHVRPHLWRYLDTDMMHRLQADGLTIPLFMYEQAKQLATYNIFSQGSSVIYNIYQSVREKDGIVPFSQLDRFLYDYKMFDLLRSGKATPRPSAKSDVTLSPAFTDEKLEHLYGRNHAEMGRFTKEFIEKRKKANRWSNKTKFHLNDIIALRDEFFSELEIAHRPHESKVVTIFTQKGGVGKSGVCLSIAGALAYTANRNNRVLVIDCDYQMTSSCALVSRLDDGAVEPQQTPSIFKLLRTCAEQRGGASSYSEFESLCASAPVPSTHPNIDIIPASDDSTFDRDFRVGAHGGDSVSADAMHQIIEIVQKHHNYDYIIIDTRPDLHASAALSYFVADEVISVLRPSGTDYGSFMNFARQMGCSVIPMLCGNKNYVPPKKSNILVNQFHTGSQNQEIMIQFLRDYAENSAYDVFDTVIPISTVVTTTSSQECTIWNAAGRADSSIDNKTLAAFRGYFTQLALNL